MKKVKYLLCAFLLSILLIGVVKAEGPYYLDFETEDLEGVNAGINIGFKDGYITFDYDYSSQKTYATMYDVQGKETKFKTLSNKRVQYAVSKDNDIYVIYQDNEDKFYLAKLSDNLSVQESVYLASNFGYYYDLYTREGIEYIHVTDEEVYVILGVEDNTIYSLFTSRDLTKEPEVKELKDSNLKKYYPEFETYQILQEVSGFNHYNRVNYKEGYIVASIYDDSMCEENAALGEPSPTIVNPDSECAQIYVELVTPEKKLAWKKNFSSDYSNISEVRIIDDYAAIIAKKKGGSDLLIFDKKGNLVQKISTTSNYSKIIDTERGFIIAQNSCELLLGAAHTNITLKQNSSNLTQGSKSPVNIQYGYLDPCCKIGPSTGGGYQSPETDSQGTRLCKDNHEVYYLYHDIKTIVSEGKGTIEVINHQKPGVPVTFVVKPEEGYVLGIVKVTDSLGNVVYFTDYTFTMPSADVTIEVTFVKAEQKENPKTADIAITLIIIGAIFSGFMLIINKRKKDFLK